jgi:hypothetical protein
MRLDLKGLIIIIGLFICFNLYSQNYFNQIKGEWIVDSIINKVTNEKTRGKFGFEGEYVRFNFKNKSTLITSNSPIDLGSEVPISIKRNTIDIVPQNIYPDQVKKLNLPIPTLPILEEPKYFILDVSDNYLLLETSNKDEQILYYYLSKLDDTKETIIDLNLPAILIKHKLSGLYFKSAHNNIPIGTHRLNTPRYLDNISLGREISHSVDLADAKLAVNKYSSVMSIKIVVNSNGKVEDVSLIRGFNETIDKEIEILLKKSKWSKLENVEKTMITLNFIFLVVE